MKIFNIAILLGYMALLLSNQIAAQSAIDYGSNDGQYIEIKSTNIYYEEYGEGTPTLLIHGGLGNISNFKMVIPELSKHFKLLAIDGPSHGRSQSVDSLSYNILAAHFVALLEKLNLNKVNVIGYSDGAIVGMLMAHMAPDKIDKLVFGAGALNPRASTPEGLQMLQSISPEILPEDFATSYKEKSPNPQDWTKFVYASKKMWLNEVWIPEEILPTIDCKVLVLFGDRDQFIPLSHALEIYRELPNSELCVLPNVYHDIYSNPEKTNPILIKFLTEN